MSIRRAFSKVALAEGGACRFSDSLDPKVNPELLH